MALKDRLKRKSTFLQIPPRNRDVSLLVAEIRRKFDEEMAKMRHEFESKLQKELENAFSIDARVEKTSMKLAAKLAVLEKGDKGEKGNDGEQGESIIGEKGEMGEKGNIGDIGEMGERGIQGSSGIDGQDGTDGKDGENGSPDTPKQVVEKVNKSQKKIQFSQILGLDKELENIKDEIKKGGGGGKKGGGMSNLQHESTSVNASTTTVTTNFNIAAAGFAIWAFYNGAIIMRGEHYTVSGMTLSLTFTPDSDSTIDLLYFRT